MRAQGARAWPLALLCLAAACAPKAPPPPLQLDCDMGFDALAAAVARDPALKLAAAPGEPYGFYNAADGAVSFVVTRPEAPAHPAILRQAASDGRMQTTGCSYGDRAAYDQLVAYVSSLGR